MDPHEFYKYSSACFKHSITIYPKPVNNHGLYLIVVNRNGRETVGKTLYRDMPYKETIEKKSSCGVIKKEVHVIPSCFDKIAAMYKDIALKNNFLKE